MEPMDNAGNNLRQETSDPLSSAAPSDAKEHAEGDSPPRRKSGGQPGNKNARKHGLYSKALTPEHLDAFPDVCEEKYLEKEVALLRLNIEALLALPNPDLNLVLRAMGTLGRLIRVDDRLKYGT